MLEAKEENVKEMTEESKEDQHGNAGMHDNSCSCSERLGRIWHGEPTFRFDPG